MEDTRRTTMISLIYVSTAAHPFSKEELIAILQQSHARNKELGVTGLLLYRDSNIIQVLEGEKTVVRQLFKDREADPRHYGVLRLTERPIKHRQFADWRLSFKDHDDSALAELPGYSQFMNLPPNPNTSPSGRDTACKLLDGFRRNMR
jgi:hypothetical protein